MSADLERINLKLEIMVHSIYFAAFYDILFYDAAFKFVVGIVKAQNVEVDE